MQPLLILCCFGGQPFLDFFHADVDLVSRPVDPTEWIAEDIAGFLLENASWVPHRSEVRAAGVELSSCDLYNVSFETASDAALAEETRAAVACRCPKGQSGVSCELRQSPIPTPAHHRPMMFIVVLAVLLALLAVLCLMVRGCFCDCFGPFAFGFKRAGSEPYDQPPNQHDIEKCLRKYREYEARQQTEIGEEIIPPPNTTAAPYDQSVPSAPPPEIYRPPSPPPAYRSVAGSCERLPQTSL